MKFRMETKPNGWNVVPARKRNNDVIGPKHSLIYDSPDSTLLATIWRLVFYIWKFIISQKNKCTLFLNNKSKQIWKSKTNLLTFLIHFKLVLKYATTRNHPQSSATTHYFRKLPTTIRNHPQPPTVIHNRPQLFTSICNRPQPSTTTNSYLQPSTTTHNHPQTRKKAKTCHKHLLRLYHKHYNGVYI